jgi:hypothetical protein
MRWERDRPLSHRRLDCGAEPGARAAALVWTKIRPACLDWQRKGIQDHPRMGDALCWRQQDKAPIQLYHGRVDSELADRRRVGDAPTLRFGPVFVGFLLCC